MFGRKRRLPRDLPASVRMSQAAYLASLEHQAHIGAFKGGVFGVLAVISILFFKGDRVILALHGLFILLYLGLIFSVWRRHEYFQSLGKATLAMADEYEIHLRATSLGALVRATQAEVAGEQFLENRELSPTEVDAIVDKALKSTKERPEALLKLNEALKLIDDALDLLVGRYPNHTLNLVLETLQAISTAEERRSIRIVLDDKTNPLSGKRP